jgi:hypothetical protein
MRQLASAPGLSGLQQNAGASSWFPHTSTGVTVVIDCDRAGRRHAATLIERLRYRGIETSAQKLIDAQRASVYPMASAPIVIGGRQHDAPFRKAWP